MMVVVLSLAACAPERKAAPTVDGGVSAVGTVDGGAGPALGTADGGASAVAGTDWSQIREIVHELRRAHPTYEAPMSTPGEREAALSIAKKSASAMAGTTDEGLTPSQRLYK